MIKVLNLCDDQVMLRKRPSFSLISEYSEFSLMHLLKNFSNIGLAREKEHFLEIFKIQVDEIILP